MWLSNAVMASKLMKAENQKVQKGRGKAWLRAEQGKAGLGMAWAKDRVGQVKEGDRVGVEEAGLESSKDCSVHSHYRSRPQRSPP
jgi:hypothetical protein